MPESMLNNLKIIANERDIPYQSFIKIILAEKIRSEQKTEWEDFESRKENV